MIISTTNTIENSKINDYLGIVSGTDIYLVGGIFGGGLANQENLYTQALSSAISKMKEKALDLGANAIIGVSTNIVSPGNLNNIIVIATGTAVFTQEVTSPGEKSKHEPEEKVKCETEEKNKSSKEPETTSKNEDMPQKKEAEHTEDSSKILPCPKCGEDLTFMGWGESDLKEKQICPLCGEKIEFANK